MNALLNPTPPKNLACYTVKNTPPPKKKKKNYSEFSRPCGRGISKTNSLLEKGEMLLFQYNISNPAQNKICY